MSKKPLGEVLDQLLSEDCISTSSMGEPSNYVGTKGRLNPVLSGVQRRRIPGVSSEQPKAPRKRRAPVTEKKTEEKNTDKPKRRYKRKIKAVVENKESVSQPEQKRRGRKPKIVANV